MKNIVYNCDCMKFMKDKPDKFYDLAIVDPPYGINISNNMGRRKYDKKSNYKKINWNSKPLDKIYFDELKRISKNQIIWGGNYFTKYLKPVNSWVLWHKINDGVSFSMVEMAWTNLNINTKLLTLYNKNKNRIHPTQKPVELYRWLLDNYAKESDKIFDSHVGSGSSRIVCYEKGFYFEGCEIDIDYFNDQEKRFEKEKEIIDLEKESYKVFISKKDKKILAKNKFLF